MTRLQGWMGVLVLGLGVGCGDVDADPPQGLEAWLPTVTGTCPGFVVGDGCREDGVSLICDFHPEGTAEPRPVRLWLNDNARSDENGGALVFFWHGLSGNATHAANTPAGLGSDVIADILSEGGIVAAPEKRSDREPPAATRLPWLLAQGRGEDDDLLVMDEVVACAHAHVGFDTRRIHSTGMSAGGLQTGQVGPRRSGYLASTALFSGGRSGAPVKQDPENRYPVILFHGGPDDQVFGISFQASTEAAYEKYQEEGHFAMICDHGANHTVPASVSAAAWRFLKDHPYGTQPSAYEMNLPDDVFDFCEF